MSITQEEDVVLPATVYVGAEIDTDEVKKISGARQSSSSLNGSSTGEPKTAGLVEEGAAAMEMTTDDEVPTQP